MSVGARGAVDQHGLRIRQKTVADKMVVPGLFQRAADASASRPILQCQLALDAGQLEQMQRSHLAFLSVMLRLSAIVATLAGCLETKQAMR
jgi:hypothetical protein